MSAEKSVARQTVPLGHILRLCIVIVAVIGGVLTPAIAASDTPSQSITISDIEAAQILIKNGRLDEARAIMETALKARPDDPEVLFLLGTIAVEQKAYDKAISYYRRILVLDPESERARLELARAFYLNHDYDNAILQFRRARAGDVPDAVKANIDHFLNAINHEREWTYAISLGLVPDTNENAGTSASQVTIYGLPFTLNSTARTTSGLGLSGEVSGEWSPLVTDNIKARIGADIYRVQYSGGAFNDMTGAVYAGAQFLFNGWDISPLLTGFDRWFANAPYVDGRGAKVTADFGITSSWQLSTTFGYQYLDYKTNAAQSGSLYSSQVQIGYTLSPSAAVQFQVGYNRQQATPAWAFSNYWVGAGYQQDLPFGFTGSVNPSYSISNYNGPFGGFGVIREDHAAVVSVGLLNRRFDVYGFTPKFSYTYTDQLSNLAIFKYNRNLFNIGLTSQF